MVFKWCYSGVSSVTVVSQWCYNCVTVVLQWNYSEKVRGMATTSNVAPTNSSVTVVIQWCYSGVTVVLQWCHT
jgi:hypothetical protein